MLDIPASNMFILTKAISIVWLKSLDYNRMMFFIKLICQNSACRKPRLPTEIAVGIDVKTPTIVSGK